MERYKPDVEVGNQKVTSIGPNLASKYLDQAFLKDRE